MKKIIMLVLALMAMTLTGCSGTQPAVNANSNKVEVMSLSRFINITNISYTGSMNNNGGSVTKVRD